MSGVVLWFSMLLIAVFAWEQLPGSWRGGICANRAAPALTVALMAVSLFVFCGVLA